MECEFIRPKSIRVLFTTERMIEFSFPTTDEDRVETDPPKPDDFDEEGGKWQLL